MYSTAALMLANGHIGDLMADASHERRANLVRTSRERVTRSRGYAGKGAISAGWLVRIVRAAPRVPAR